MEATLPVETMLQRALRLHGNGEDKAATEAWLAVLRTDPTLFEALNSLGCLANATGHRAAARTAWEQAVRCHPGNPVGRVNLGNLLLEDEDIDGACQQFQAALGVNPGFPEAHQGLARVLAERGDEAAAWHRRKGFIGHAIVSKPYRGPGSGVPVLLLVSAAGGNVPTRAWLDDHSFAVTALHTEFFDPSHPLPPHELVVNAIGDADLCHEALTAAEAIVARCKAPVINPPALIKQTGRAANTWRLAAIPGVVAPRITPLTRSALLAADDLCYPLLVRVPGRHTGRHFVYVESQAALAPAVAALPGTDLLAVQYLDARGPDGLARKYRVMFIDGRLYPLHLALSADWKVHYFTADMARVAAHRDEESRFLRDMNGVLGDRAMCALAVIAEALGLDYAGIDFALTPDRDVLLFEANATMVVNPPDADPLWDYRRPAVAAIMEAIRRLLSRQAAAGSVLSSVSSLVA